jgi:hypothetical protein
MRRTLLLVALVLLSAGAGAGGAWAVLTRPWVTPPPPEPPPPELSTEFPGGKPIDAAAITTGQIAIERMPREVTTALELHSTEIVRTSEILASKQDRITGACAPGSAIRLVAADGTVVCQRLPRGVVSVSALAGQTRISATKTAQGSVPGGVGRYQTEGEDDFLVVPVVLPDGAIVTGFSYTFWDTHARADGAAYLYRSDDAVMAGVRTEGAREEVRLVETEKIQDRKVDNAGFSYFVYMQLSGEAGSAFMPIAASVTYRLP